MTDNDLVVGGAIGDGPEALARGIATYFGMYMGGPETFERAAAYVEGIEMAVLVTGGGSPLGEEERALLMDRPEGHRTPDQEREDIRRLEPLPAKQFVTLPRVDE